MQRPKGGFFNLTHPSKIWTKTCPPRAALTVSFLAAPDGERPEGAGRGVDTHKSLCAATCDPGLNKVSTREEQNQHIFFKDRKRQKVGDVA